MEVLTDSEALQLARMCDQALQLAETMLKSLETHRTRAPKICEDGECITEDDTRRDLHCRIGVALGPVTAGALGTLQVGYPFHPTQTILSQKICNLWLCVEIDMRPMVMCGNFQNFWMCCYL